MLMINDNYISEQEYPKKKFGNQNRGFSAVYFKEFNWLEYSIEKDGVFCFPCSMFSATHVEDTFTLTGFNNWKKVSFIIYILYLYLKI